MSLFFRNAASLLSDGDQNGTWLRFMVDHDPGRRRRRPGARTARAAPRPRRRTAAGGRSTGIDPNFLHVNPYPNTAAPGQTRECEAGNETYAQGKQSIGNVPGNQGVETDEQGPKRRRESDGGLATDVSEAHRPAAAARPDQPGARGRDRAADHRGRAPGSRSPSRCRGSDPFQFHAVFQTSNNLRLDSPVRIAGVNVGKVVEVEREEDSDLVKVTMEMKEAGLPIHKDATAEDPLAHLPRGQLLRRPDARARRSGDELEDGDTIPVTQTSTPVQLDELLTALQTNDREALQDLLNGLGDGLERQADRRGRRATRTRVVRGESAAKSLNDSHRPRARRR